MVGDVATIMVDFAGALAAAWMVSVGIVGYFSKPMMIWERVVAIVSGLCLITPIDAFAGAVEANIVGLVLLVLFIGREFLTRRRLSPAE